MNRKPFSAWSILEPDLAALPLDQLLYDGEPHAAAFDLVARAQGLEHAEDALAELCRDARAVIGHAELGRLAADAAGRPGVDRDLPVSWMVMVWK